MKEGDPPGGEQIQVGLVLHIFDFWKENTFVDNRPL